LPLADLRGLAQLATEATVETTNLVEGIHRGVLSAVLPSSPRHADRTGGLTGWIYRTIRRIVRLSGIGSAALLQGIDRVAGSDPPIDTDARRRFLSVLNGVLGDHLAASDNPLARSFSLRTADGSPLESFVPNGPPADGPPVNGLAVDGLAVEGPAPETSAVGASVPDTPAVDPGTPLNETLIVFVHGLCLDDRHWAGTRDGAGHVDALSSAVDATPIFARYNTGRSIAANGRQLSRHLDGLERMARRRGFRSRIVLVAHSMGGLVVRQALAFAQTESARWPGLVSEVIYLGTPHRGAALEQIGSWVEECLRWSRFTEPFTALTGIRSRGIQDLQHGASGKAAFTGSDPPPALPPSGRCLYVAGNLKPRVPTSGPVGDGLVSVSSALNRPAASPVATRRVFPKIGHFALLRDPAVTRNLTEWLTDTTRQPA